MNILEALLLGIVQGLTEFLPVSSSGHIELGKAVLGLNLEGDNLLFSIVVHAATALSTLVVFRKDIGILLKGIFRFRWNDETQFAAKIVVSMLPVGFVGLLFKHEIEALFEGNVLLVGSMLLVTGGLLMLTHFFKKQSGSEPGFVQAIIIGLAQAVAILPGISRSGATIATALLAGVDRNHAARFSFLMALPPILGATLLEVKDYAQAGEQASHLPATVLVAGFLAAFVVGLLACTLMINLVRKQKLVYFALYCLVAGTTAIAWKLFL
jgi:undecaprenyl-diphosphatase